MTLIETIDKIRALRQEADTEMEQNLYDPLGHAEERANKLREEADQLEKDMETRVRWRHPQ